MKLAGVYKALAINAVILTAFLAPFLLPFMLSSTSLYYAKYKSSKERTQAAQSNGFIPFREVVRELYYKRFVNMVQHNSDCFEAYKRLIYKPIANSSCVHSNLEFQKTYSFGSDSTRNHTPSAVKPSYSIIILGDSHAMGWGVSDSEIFTAYLASRGIGSYNLAVSSYGTAREFERLREWSEVYPVKFRDAKSIVIQYHSTDHTENLLYLDKDKNYQLETQKAYAYYASKDSPLTRVNSYGISYYDNTWRELMHPKNFKYLSGKLIFWIRDHLISSFSNVNAHPFNSYPFIEKVVDDDLSGESRATIFWQVVIRNKD
jgi:hypothetical protein